MCTYLLHTVPSLTGPVPTGSTVEARRSIYRRLSRAPCPRSDDRSVTPHAVTFPAYIPPMIHTAYTFIEHRTYTYTYKTYNRYRTSSHIVQSPSFHLMHQVAVLHLEVMHGHVVVFAKPSLHPDILSALGSLKCRESAYSRCMRYDMYWFGLWLSYA